MIKLTKRKAKILARVKPPLESIANVLIASAGIPPCMHLKPFTGKQSAGFSVSINETPRQAAPSIYYHHQIK